MDISLKSNGMSPKEGNEENVNRTLKSLLTDPHKLFQKLRFINKMAFTQSILSFKDPPSYYRMLCTLEM